MRIIHENLTCRERLYSAWVSGGPIFWPTAYILSNFFKTDYLATRSQYIVIWKILPFVHDQSAMIFDLSIKC